MNISLPRKQQGAALFIALIMLLALTILAVSNMRGVTLESRITASRVESSRLQNLADAALREGEFRFYGPAYLREKLEPNKNNCRKSNKLNKQGNNRPCLLEEMDDTQLASFFKTPLSFLKGGYSSTHGYKTTGAGTDVAGDTDTLAWMPYRGLDPEQTRYVATTDKTGRSYWNGYRIPGDDQTTNPHYGSSLGEGAGSGIRALFLINGQGDDQVVAQSTIQVFYLGLNN